MTLLKTSLPIILCLQVLQEVPASLKGQTDTSHVAAFFAARLADWYDAMHDE